MRHLPQRQLPAGGQPARQPRALCVDRRSGDRQLRHLPQGQFQFMGQWALSRQRQRFERLRELPLRWVPERGRQAQHGGAQRRHRVRKLPQHQRLGRRQGRPRHVHRGHQLHQLPRRHDRHGQAARAHARRIHRLLCLPQRQPGRLETDQVDAHPTGSDGAMRELPHRQLPARRRPARQPHPVPNGAGVGVGQLRQLPQGQHHELGQRQVPRQLRRDDGLRHLPQRGLPQRGGQARQRDPRRGDGQLRELPQEHHHLGRRQGRSQHLHRGHQLRQLPRRVGHRQAIEPHPRRRDQLLCLPQRQPGAVDADQVEPHPGHRHRGLRLVPHRRLPARRRPARQPHPVPDGGGVGSGQLRQLPQGQHHELGQRQVPRQLRRDDGLRRLPQRGLPQRGGQAQPTRPTPR